MKSTIALFFGILASLSVGLVAHGQNPFYFTSLQLAGDPDNGECLSTNGIANLWTTCGEGGGGSGTVTSVGMTVPTGLSISGSPVTTSGTLALSLTNGYIIPLSASTTQWATAYGWGNHASSSYLTSNQTITLSGDASGSGTTGITVTVADDSHAHTGSTISGIDISSDTNLAGDSEIVLTGDTLSIAASIARDVELHTAVTLGGEDYLSLSTQLITANAINPDNLASADFGAFSCNGTSCSLDATYLTTVDISDDTNLAAGRSLTLTGDSVAADAETYSFSKTLYIEDPIADDDLQTIWTTQLPVTLSSISCESDQTVNFDLLVDDGSPAGVNGSDIACTTFATDSSLAGDVTIAAGDRLDLAISSVSGAPTWVSITFTGTYDD